MDCRFLRPVRAVFALRDLERTCGTSRTEIRCRVVATSPPPDVPDSGDLRRHRLHQLACGIADAVLAALFAVVLAGLFLPIIRAGLLVVPRLRPPDVVAQKSVVRAGFSVTNLHPWPVTISGLRGDCGCTRGFLARKLPFVLYPLQSALLEIAVDAPIKEGPFLHTVLVTTLGGADSTPVTVRARVSNRQTKGT